MRGTKMIRNIQLLIRSFSGLLGSKKVCYARYCYEFQKLFELQKMSAYTLKDYCKERLWKKIAILGDNEISCAVASNIKQGGKAGNMVTLFTKNKIKGWQHLRYDFDIQTIKNVRELPLDRYDCLLIADYSFYLRYLFLKKLGRLKPEKEIINVNILLDQVMERQVGYAIKNVRENARGGVIITHLKIPSYAEVPKGKAQRRYSPNISANSKEVLQLLFGYKKNEEYEAICKEFLEQRSWIKKGALVLSDDVSGTYFNRLNGERKNVYFKEAENTIWLLGPCVVSGSYAEDKETIASLLQNQINESDFDARYNVKAISTIPDEVQYLKILRVLSLKENDIVVVIDDKRTVINPKMSEELKNEMVAVMAQEDFYIDGPIHCNYRGNRIIADLLFKHLQTGEWEEDILRKEEVSVNKEVLYSNNEELNFFLQNLQKKKIESSNAGCIVMNCNPFTLGHRYLIEHALQKVDVLYCFVVEEDRSFFSFQDRLFLVAEGTKDLQNVVVVPSGRFILSADTFSEYFHKEDKSVGKIDPSKDLYLFGQYIAPCLDIKKRFVGEEPIDMVTRQYNESMRAILPQYGVAVDIIKRKETNGEVISASKVRNCLAERDFDGIRALVPETTYKFLNEHCF